MVCCFSLRASAQTFGVAQELWTGLSTNEFAYPDSAVFTNTPATTTKVLTSFSTAKLGDGYGQRLRAFLLPPTSGSYVFAIASDEWSDLYLSTDETPEHRVRIANVNSATGQKDFDNEPNQTSAPIPLLAGHRYYIEALHREGFGSDWLDVRWTLPDDTTEEPINSKPGAGKAERLIPFRTNLIVTPALLKHPTNTVALAGRSAIFSLLVSNQAPVTYQWQENSVDIPGATDSVLTLAQVTEAKNGGKSYRCRISNEVGETLSAQVGVTVVPDTTLPELSSVFAIGTGALLVTFSEAVSDPSAVTLSNYSLPGVTIQRAERALDPSQVILRTTALTLNQSYTLSVKGVTDLAGNPVAVGTALAFQAQTYYSTGVGATNAIGNVTPVSNGFDFTAGGKDIAGKSDQFLFQWSLLAGNFDFQVRVESLGLSDMLAKAGLMAREDLDGDSRFAAVFTTPSLNGSVFQSRNQPGKDAVSVGSNPINYPNTWLRLRRAGNLVSGYASSDAKNWTLIGSASISLPDLIYVGLASTSRNTNSTTLAKFRDLSDATGKPLGRSVRSGKEPPGPSSRRTGLVISEIMYHPKSREDKKELEFVEIFNSQPFFEDMSGYQLQGDIQFTFPANTLIEGGSYLVVAKSPTDIESVYGLRGVMGPYSNSLPNNVGTVILRNELGGIFQEVNYNSQYPWPVAPDGTGHSLVLARPSYGEGNVLGWSASDVMGGSPGQYDGIGAEPLRGVLINEFLPNPGAGQSEFIELYNHTTESIDLSGAWLSDSPTTNKFQIPPSTTIPAHGFVSFTGLPFSLSSQGESIYFVNPAQTRVLDCLHYKGASRGISQGRTPDGSTGVGQLSTVTPGEANSPARISDVVINELMYAPISGDNDDEFIELYNRTDAPISLANWKFSEAVTFTFPSNAVISAKGYVVVGRNLARLLSNYPNLQLQNAFGNYSGSLGNSGDYLQLLRPEVVVSTNANLTLATNTTHVVVNEVQYETGGRWGNWSDGGGSSLELIDPDSDPNRASNWADSDETKKAPWTNVEFTGRADLGAMESPASLQVFLQNAGEALLDDVEVFTATGKTNFLRNPNFEVGITNWVAQGTHERSSLETTEGYNSQQSLHIRASGRGDNGGNRIRTGWSLPVPNNAITTIRAKVRWLAGTPHILIRLRGNYLECPGIMTLPKNLGTPGAPNSRRVENAGPALFDVAHEPVLPLANQPILVTAHAVDPDGVASLLLRYRIDSSLTATNYSELQMVDDGTQGDEIPGDGIYSVLIPGQANNSMIAFYLQAADGAKASASSRFPKAAPDRECLIHVGETQAPGNLAAYRLWCTTNVVAKWKTRGKQSNDPLDCTFVYNNYRILYNAETLYSGSPWHTPDYSGPTGSDPVCDYVFHAAPDDLLLGSEDFVLASIGNEDNDSTKLGEQSSYWIARKMGIPYNYRRFISVHFNGVRRASSVYEDTQQPSGDIIKEYYAGDTDGPLHKIEDWFEFNDGGDARSGNVDATLQLFTSLEGKKVARYRVSWRPRAVGAGQNPNDFSELFKVVDALNSTSPEPYNTAVLSAMNVQRWLSVFAMEHIVGNWDSYGYSRGKNMYAYKPSRGKFDLLLWDIDFDLGKGDGTSMDVYINNDPVIDRLYKMPLFRRIYLRIFQEATDTALRDDRFGPLLDAKYKSLLDNGAGPSSPVPLKTFVQGRRAYLLDSVIPKTNFTVFASDTLVTNVNYLVLTGAAPVIVDHIAVNGVVYPLQWTSTADRPILWSLQMPLKAGANDLVVQAFDRFGNLVTNGTRNLKVVNTGVDPLPEGNVVINEISYSPAQPDTGYIELYNRSKDSAFDLTGWRLSGVNFDFPSGAILLPGRYVVVVKDQFAFGAKFGFRTPILGEFSGNLNPVGETLSLLRPGLAAGESIVVDRVRYEANAPWPNSPTTAGVSLELIDPSQDNSRVSNWTDDGDGWRFVSATGKAGGTNLFVFLNAPGDVYLDDIRLVEGSNPTQGSNLIPNGDFEQPLENAWRFGTNHILSTLDRSVVFDGQASLHLISTSAGTATTNNSMYQLNLPITTSNIYTLSYWMHFGSDQSSNVVLRLGNPNGVLISSEPATRRLGSPGAPNGSIGILPSYPALWLNEVGPYNSTGPKDAQGEQDPWVELLNTGTTPISLDGFYLSDSYSNLKSWAFPANAVIPPGAFLVVWLDGDADQSSPNQWHTSFRIQPTEGSVVLSRTVGGQSQIVDYLNYAGIRPDEAYGAFPDGQPFFRDVISFPTPGEPNNGSSKPIEVKINEWMASNTGFILDPANVPPAADDWFELYNPGRTEADLSGYFLTDNTQNKNQYKIPDGVKIPAGGYLFVWADGSPSQNSTNSSDLHVNFQLSKSGEAIGLFAPDGSLVDSVTFAAQTNNISQGRLPDGGASIVFFDHPTPGSANKLLGQNTAPVFDPIGNKVIDERKRFTLRLTAQDAEEGSDQLRYSLGGDVPVGASLTPDGLFVWRPSEAQGPGVYNVTFLVHDNGSPSLQGEKTVTFTVREVNQAPIFLDPRPRYVRAGEALVFNTAVDLDLPPQALSFRLGAGAPNGVLLDPVSGVVSWTPSDSQVGQTYFISVVATDNGAPNLSASFDYQVQVFPAASAVIVVSPSWDGTGVTLHWTAEHVGDSFQVEFKDDLSSAWQSIGSPIVATTVSVSFTDNPQKKALRLYRIRKL